MKKRVVAVVLIIVMFFSMCPIISSAAYDYLFPVNNGGKIAYVYGYSSSYGSRFHSGIDIHSSGDDTIYAAYDGVVGATANSCWHVSCGYQCEHYNTYGNYIRVNQDDGTKAYYGHLLKDSLMVSVGQRVKKGQPIAKMGSSGHSTGKHLHFEVRLGNNKINVNPTSSGGSISYSYVGYNNVSVDNSTNPNDYPYPARNLFFTSPVQTGDDVKWVQSVLSKLGYSVAIDGSYGPSTRDAIKAFQRDHGLSVDGSCGPATRAKLLEEWNRVSGVVVVNKPTWATIKANLTELTVGEIISFEFDSDSADSYTIGIDCNNNRVLTETVGNNKSFSYTCTQSGNYSAYISATNSAGGLDSSRVYWTVKEKEITVYTITYNANGGSGGPSSQQKNKGQSLTISSEFPERSGYSFVGWSTSAISDEAQYIPGSTFETDADITLYAVWEMNVHEHNWIWITDKEATCTENGMRHQECECGATQNEEYIGVFHDFGEWVVVDRETEYPFTITHQRTCSVCGETEQYLITATPGNPDEILYGDVNSDGTIDGLDATALLQYLAEWEVDIDFYAADVNADGVIDGLDATLLLQYLAEWDVILGSNK